ncbi:MAG: hypothetical protein ABIA74_02700 [bacterium]
MEQEKQERITLYPDKELKKEIEDIAERESRSVNNFILLLLKKCVEEQKPKKKKKKNTSSKSPKIHAIF